MTKYISDILQAREPHFTHQLRDLERLSHRSGEDLKLVSHLIQARTQLLQALNLDKQDTTAKELYFALRKKASDDSKALEKKLNIKSDDAPEKVVQSCIDFVLKQTKNPKVWTLKASVVRKQLKAIPPSKLLKFFALRSIDSALKREPLTQLIVFAEKVEGKKWFDSYKNYASKLTVSDFDYQKIEVSYVKQQRVSKLKKSKLNLSQTINLNYDFAGIVITPLDKRFEGDVLFYVNGIVDGIRQLKYASLFLKIKSLDPEFSKIIAAIREKGFNAIASRHSRFGWHPYAHKIDYKQDNDDPFALSIFEDDLPNVKITHVIEDGSTWRHEILLVKDKNHLISCNLSDVIINLANNHLPEESIVKFGQSALRTELYRRYLAHPNISENPNG